MKRIRKQNRKLNVKQTSVQVAIISFVYDYWSFRNTSLSALSSTKSKRQYSLIETQIAKLQK